MTILALSGRTAVEDRGPLWWQEDSERRLAQPFAQTLQGIFAIGHGVTFSPGFICPAESESVWAFNDIRKLNLVTSNPLLNIDHISGWRHCCVFAGKGVLVVGSSAAFGGIILV